MKITKYYKIKGYVYGNYWGGGKGAYKSEEYEGNDLEKLMEEIKEDLKSGALDGGMGYESLIGAILDIETISSIIIKGQNYCNSEFSIDYIGELEEKEEDFLREILLYN